MLPNFIGIGSLKSGTTSLRKWLIAHPDVFIPDRELGFFNDKVNEQDLKRYSGYFDSVTSEKIVGDISPGYMYRPFAAKTIKKMLGNVKILASLRHPVDRMYSSFWMKIRNGVENFDSFETCYRLKNDFFKNIHSKSFYFEALKRYYDIFPKDNIKIIIFDDLEATSFDVYKDLLKFLGICEHKLTLRTYNKGLSNVLVNVVNIVKGLGVKKVLPGRVWENLKGFSYKYFPKYPVIDRDIYLELLKGYEEDIVKTGELIGRDLSFWLK